MTKKEMVAKINANMDSFLGQNTLALGSKNKARLETLLQRSEEIKIVSDKIAKLQTEHLSEVTEQERLRFHLGERHPLEEYLAEQDDWKMTRMILWYRFFDR